MRPRIDPPAGLLELARKQGSVITGVQAQQFALGRRPIERQLATGRWGRLTDGVFFLQSGSPPWLAYAWAGVLLGGDAARLGGAAAGFLHGLSDRAADRIEVLVPEQTRRAGRERWTFVREREYVRLRSVGRPPRICLEDAVLDLGTGMSETELIDLVTRAIQTRRTSSQLLRSVVDRRNRLANRELLIGVLADVGEGAESPLEVAYLRDVETAHHLPRGSRQVRRERNVRDVVYAEFATVAELDWRLGHEGAGRFRDMARDNRAALAGEQTLRFGWHDVRGDPCAVARLVSSVLQQRGWSGVPTPCRRCRQS